ncbi:hypothetical protein [Bulleidia sp. zg-1006]|uniref:hypothetical protein n=1 Tax=Bulleidia sp. zg-1006 TaxID=2806552 RepID=UPI001939AEA5|nr:hypothetical protein [Bulleidia sp. zg-1006]QRG87354.1 hypothetical protein JOS54_03335 [Bulleidia sp. zg-1006]
MKNSKAKLLYKAIQDCLLEVAIFSILIHICAEKYRIYALLSSLLYLLFKYKKWYYFLIFPLLVIPCFLKVSIQLNHLTLIEKREASSVMVDSFGQKIILKRTLQEPLGSLYAIEGKVEKSNHQDLLTLPLLTQRDSLKPKEIHLLRQGKGYLAQIEKKIEEVSFKQKDFLQSILLGYYQKGFFHGFAWIGLVKMISFLFRYHLDRTQRKYLEIILYTLILIFLSYQTILVLHILCHFISFLNWDKANQYGLLLYSSLLLFQKEFFSLGILVALFYQSEFLWRLKKRDAFFLRFLCSMYVFGSFQILMTIGYSFFRKIQAFLYLICLFYVYTKQAFLFNSIQILFHPFTFLDNLRIGYSFSCLWWVLIGVFFFLKRKTMFLILCSIFILISPYFSRQVILVSRQGLPLFLLQNGQHLKIVHAGQCLDNFLENYQKKYPFRDYVLIDGRKKLIQMGDFLWNFSDQTPKYKAKYLILDNAKNFIEKMDRSEAKILILSKSLKISQEQFLKENHKLYFSLQEEKGLRVLFWKFGIQIQTGKGNFAIMSADE